MLLWEREEIQELSSDLDDLEYVPRKEKKRSKSQSIWCGICDSQLPHKGAVCPVCGGLNKSKKPKRHYEETEYD